MIRALLRTLPWSVALGGTAVAEPGSDDAPTETPKAGTLAEGRRAQGRSVTKAERKTAKKAKKKHDKSARKHHNKHHHKAKGADPKPAMRPRLPSPTPAP